MFDHDLEPKKSVRGPGHPPHDPSIEQRQQAETLSGFGISHSDIAAFIGIARQTLETHYADELAIGRIKADAKVAGSLFKKATSDDHPQATTAAIWWEKTRAGRKEPKQQHEFSGPNGGPIETKDVTARERIASRIAGIATRKGSVGDLGGTDG